MNKIRVIVLGFFFSSCAMACPPSALNLDHVKQQLMHYHDSGKYLQEQTHVIEQAKAYLVKRLQMPHKRKLAIVLDIDETSLSNYKDMVQLSFGGTLKQIDMAEAKATDPAISPTLKLYQFAKAHNVAVFFVTGRREIYQQATIKNLRKAGFAQFDGLVLKPNNYHQSSVVPYKASARKYIAEHGYDIVLNIGDQMSDLQGGYADRAYKLPNPFYYIR